MLSNVYARLEYLGLISKKPKNLFKPFIMSNSIVIVYHLPLSSLNHWLAVAVVKVLFVTPLQKMMARQGR